MTPLAQLELRHLAAPKRIRAGRVVTYSLRVTNQGGGTATDVRVADELPRGARRLTASSSRGRCTGAPIVVCRLGSIGPERSATIRIRARLTRVGRAVNRASVQSASYDEIGVNNSASATTQVVRR